MESPLILPYRGVMPKIHPTAFIAPGAVVVGDVEIGAGSSVWFGCVLRGDMNAIRIGARVNLQEGCVVHVSLDKQRALAEGHYPSEGYPVIVGDDVTVGHMALLHSFTIEDKAFISMRATVMDGAVVKSRGVLGAGALLPPGKCVGEGELWTGSPAVLRRKLTDDDLAHFCSRAGQYARLATEYTEGQTSWNS